MTEYQRQAEDFLARSGTTMKITRDGDVRGFPFDKSDHHMHEKYLISMRRGCRSYEFPFYDCAANFHTNKRPTAYDVLSCLEKYEVPSDDWDFAHEFGYDIHDKESFNRVSKIRKACEEQYAALYLMFGDQWMEELRQIN